MMERWKCRRSQAINRAIVEAAEMSDTPETVEEKLEQADKLIEKAQEAFAKAEDLLPGSSRKLTRTVQRPKWKC